MSIIIQTKHCKLSHRFRHLIASYLRRAMRREQHQLSSVTLTIDATTISGEPGYRCKLRLLSPYLGDIVVDDMGDTVWSTMQQTTARARHAFRRKLHKRLSKYRRSKRDELARWLPHAVSRRFAELDFGDDTRGARQSNVQELRLNAFDSDQRIIRLPKERWNGSPGPEELN